MVNEKHSLPIRWVRSAVLCLVMIAAWGCVESPRVVDANSAAVATTRPVFEEGKFFPIFDGKTLKDWKVVQFGGEGRVWVKDGLLHVGMGEGCTGLTWTGPILREDYELSLEAKRVEGSDFFCGLTFPVGKEPVTLVLGGWGGDLVGLSCIDGYDASENASTAVMAFKKNRWYDICVKVVADRIVCSVDDKEIVNVEREGRKFSVRWEVEESVPLGLATFKTHGAMRNIRLRKLLDAEK